MVAHAPPESSANLTYPCRYCGFINDAAQHKQYMEDHHAWALESRTDEERDRLVRVLLEVASDTIVSAAYTVACELCGSRALFPVGNMQEYFRTAHPG